MKYDYNEYCQTLTSNTDVDQSEIFEYEGTPYELLCDQLFQQFQFHLESNFSLFDIKPGFFFFNNDRRVNGWAWKDNDIYINSFNIGTVHKLRELFLNIDLTKLLKSAPELAKLSPIQEPLRSPLNDLLFNSSMIYLFYHEAGHLIQFSSTRSLSKTSEKPKKTVSKFDILDHVYELDSDLFAAIRLSRHITFGWDKFNEKHKTKENLERMILSSVLGAAVFKMLYIEFSKEIYYEERTHPHSFIRAMAIMNTVIEYTNIHAEKYLGTKLDHENLVKDSIVLFDEVLPLLLGDNAIDNLRLIYKNDGDKILKYYNKLSGLIEANPKTAIYQRNKKVKNAVIR